MNIVKRCKNCGDFFPAKPLSLQFYCKKKNCQERSKRFLKKIKRDRYITLHNFDLYNLSRPIFYNNKVIDYERVCRICGAPLKKQDGSYSPHKKYCHQTRFCTSVYLYELVNWGSTSSAYIRENQDTYQERIKNFIKKKEIGEHFRSFHFCICESCEKVCLSSSSNNYYYQHLIKQHLIKPRPPSIHIHHKYPVHILTWENIHLIWDKRNLIALCPECHHKQEHFLKTTSEINYMKITDFIGDKK